MLIKDISIGVFCLDIRYNKTPRFALSFILELSMFPYTITFFFKLSVIITGTEAEFITTSDMNDLIKSSRTLRNSLNILLSL